MAIEYNLSYTAEDIDHKLSIINISRNLLPYPYIDFSSESITDFKLMDNGDGTINVNGMIYPSDKSKIVFLTEVLLEPGTYTISTNCISSNIGLQISYNGFSYLIFENPKSIEITQTALIRIYLYISDNSSSEVINIQNVVIKPQLERGNQASLWEPFIFTIGTYVDNRFNSIINRLNNDLTTSPVSRIANIILTADQWLGTVSPYFQQVEIEGITKNTQVDLTPSAEQLSILYDKDLSFVTENDDGTVTVYAIGQKPENDYIIQATLTEVIR